MRFTWTIPRGEFVLSSKSTASRLKINPKWFDNSPSLNRGEWLKRATAALLHVCVFEKSTFKKHT